MTTAQTAVAIPSELADHYFMTLRTALRKGRAHLRDAATGTPIGDPVGALIGWRRGPRVFLIPMVSFLVFQTYRGPAFSTPHASIWALAKELVRARAIATDGGRVVTKRVTIAGKPHVVFDVDAANLDDARAAHEEPGAQRSARGPGNGGPNQAFTDDTAASRALAGQADSEVV